MNVEMFTIYDTKVLVFSAPFFAANIGTAIRIVQDTLRDRDTALARHPNDFVLYCLGSFNSQTGELTPRKPENLGVIATFLPTETQPLFTGVK